MSNRTTKRLGWLPDLPDQRDLLLSLDTGSLPAKVDLRPQDVAPIYDQGELGSCHDSETEVLTDDGWRLFADLTGEERLATVDPATAELTFERPTRLVRSPYVGTVYVMSGRSVDFRVTPDHKMLVRKWDEKARTLTSEYSLIAAKDLGWYSGLLNRVSWNGSSASDVYVLPGVGHKHKPQRESLSIPMGAWLRFLGFYLAEGTMLKRDQRVGVASYKVQIAAGTMKKKTFARAIFADMGLHALELSDRFTFSNRRLYEAMEGLGLCGVRAPQKFVPAFVFQQTAGHIREFLMGHFMGDGSEQNGMKSHYTSSARLADDLQRLIFLSGQETVLSVRQARAASMTGTGRVISGNYPEHRVSVRSRNRVSIERKHDVTTEPYAGEVFCAEVPTHHTLVTRRNGKILISGNCTANAIAAGLRFTLHKQGLPDVDPSRLYIYFKEREREGTVSEDSGAMIRDGLKVVAKGFVPESEWPYDISTFATPPKPEAELDAEASRDRVIKYVRVPRDAGMRACLAAGYPFVFGISVYESFESALNGVIPLPEASEKLLGGHALICVGYEDATQRYIFRNSWGQSWGQIGYGSIPYSYLHRSNLSSDFWSVRLEVER